MGVTSLIQNINLTLLTQQNADEITEQESTLAAQQETIGAQETDIESALGNGDNPANAANELFGCYPLFVGREHARRYKEAHESIKIPVDGILWNRPVGPAFFKGHHDSVKVPEQLSFAPETVAGSVGDDPSSYPQLAFDNMFLADGTQTQTKNLVEISEVMPDKWAVYEGSCDKGEWVEPGVLGYRVHVTNEDIHYFKYSHPTLRTTEYLCETVSFKVAEGSVFKHKDLSNILVAVSAAPNLVTPDVPPIKGTFTPRFMNAFNSLKSLEGRNRIESKLVAAGKTAAESLAAYNEFIARLEHISSDAVVESGAHDTNSEIFKRGICYTDQIVYTFIFDEENSEVQVLEQYNYSDGTFVDPNQFIDDKLSDNVVSVLDVLLEDSPLRFEYEGARGKYQNKLRMKRFPRNSKFSLKKVARTSIAVAQNKTIAQIDTERLAYSTSVATELKPVLKHRMFKAAELYFAAHATVATGDEATYYTQKATDYGLLASAMATHALTFEGATVTDPTPVPWNAGDGGLLDILVEDGKVLSGYHYFSPRTVTIADSAAERTFVPTYELNYATSQLDTRTTTVETTTNSLITKNAFYVTTSDTDISPGGLFIKFINETRELTQPYNLIPTKSTTNMAREWRRLKQGTQLIQTTAPIYLWFNGYAPHGGYLQDFFPFSSRTVDEENQYLYELWELPTSTAADFKSGPALDLLQSDIDTTLNGEVFAFPFVRNTGSIMGQYNFEITGVESFRDKHVRMLPNSILSAALQNADINFTQVVLPGGVMREQLQDGTIDGAEFNSLLNNVGIGMLDQSGAQYCNTSICQEYLSVYLILVNATFWDSLTDEQREIFHSTRRSINEEAFASDTSANEELLTQLRAGEFSGITESTISPAGITELKALTDAYVAERVDPTNVNYNATMKAVWDIYNPTN